MEREYDPCDCCGIKNETARLTGRCASCRRLYGTDLNHGVGHPAKAPSKREPQTMADAIAFTQRRRARRLAGGAL